MPAHNKHEYEGDWLMTITTQILSKLQYVVEVNVGRVKDSKYYQDIMLMPPFKRVITVIGLFLASQLVIFVLLYLLVYWVRPQVLCWRRLHFPCWCQV